MFDGLIGKAFDNVVPKQLDLGNFDKAISWLRDSVFCAHSMGISNGQLRDLLSSWLDFICDCDEIYSYHCFALEAYARVIFNELTDTDFNFGGSK